MRTFEIPVLVKVTVEVSDAGATRVIGAKADNECAPWSGSTEPAAWEPGPQLWHTDFGDDVIEDAWRQAYEFLERHDLVTVMRVARREAALVAALKLFDRWPAHARQDGLQSAYRAAHNALGLVDQAQRADPFKFYLRRSPRKADRRFTALEAKALLALLNSAEGNGHDFGFIEDLRGVIEAPQIGGVVSSLVKKGVIVVHEAERTDSGLWTQFTWPPEEQARRPYVEQLRREVVRCA